MTNSVSPEGSRRNSSPISTVRFSSPGQGTVLRKRNELVVSGKPAHPPHASCWPVGVPGFLLRPMTQAMYFVQTPQVVVIDLVQQARGSPRLPDGQTFGERQAILVWRIDRPLRRRCARRRHDRNRREDVGWTVSGRRHTKELHVIERFHLIEDGKVLEANVRVEDPGAFTAPWNAIQRFRQYEAAVRQIGIARIAQLASAPEGPLTELICADNPNSFFPGTSALPLPQAVAPDF